MPPEPVFQNIRQQMCGPIAQMVRAFGMKPKVRDSSPSQVETFSDTFTKTSVRVSKMRAVSRAELTFQMLTFLKNILYRQNHY